MSLLQSLLVLCLLCAVVHTHASDRIINERTENQVVPASNLTLFLEDPDCIVSPCAGAPPLDSLRSLCKHSACADNLQAQAGWYLYRDVPTRTTTLPGLYSRRVHWVIWQNLSCALAPHQHIMHQHVTTTFVFTDAGVVLATPLSFHQFQDSAFPLIYSLRSSASVPSPLQINLYFNHEFSSTSFPLIVAPTVVNTHKVHNHPQLRSATLTAVDLFHSPLDGHCYDKRLADRVGLWTPRAALRVAKRESETAIHADIIWHRSPLFFRSRLNNDTEALQV